MNEDYHELFFLLGCQRSGTTLTRLILDSHSKIHCYDEYKSYDILSDKKLFLSTIQKKPVHQLIGFKTLVYSEQMQEHFLYDWLKQRKVDNKFQSCKMIFLLRDSRDVVSSLIQYLQKDSSYSLGWIENIFNFWSEYMPNLLTKFQNELNIVKNSKNKIVSYVSLFWKIKTSSVLQYLDSNMSILPIKYEQLCVQPKNETMKICDFLDINWEENLINHEKIPHDEINKDGTTVGKNDPAKPVFSSSINKYKKFLSSDEEKEILQITGDLMEKLGYKF